NGGKQWKAATVDARDHLYGVTFPSSTSAVGYASGTYGRVLRTDDHGLTWTSVASGKDEHFNQISAFNEERVAAAGASGTVMVSVDGGKEWTSTKPCGTTGINGIVYAAEDLIVAVGKAGCVARSSDN